MIGLEYILLMNKEISNTNLAEDLGIAKQNISRWFKGERRIPEKYLSVLEEKLKIPAIYFQKELNEIDKLEIQKISLENVIDENTFEYEDTIIDEKGEEIEVMATHTDSNLHFAIDMTNYEINKIKLKIKMDTLLDNCFLYKETDEDNHSLGDEKLYEAENLLRKFDELISLYATDCVDKGIFNEVITAIKVVYTNEFSGNKFVNKLAKEIREQDEEKQKIAKEILEFSKYL